MKGKTITIILIMVVIGLLVYIALGKLKQTKVIPTSQSDRSNSGEQVVKGTYTYTNHGFSIELPNGFASHEEQSEGGPSISISLPEGNLSYVTNAAFWEQYSHKDFKYLKDEKVGQTTFKLYSYGDHILYWFKQGNVGYEFSGVDLDTLKTFKFVGWAPKAGCQDEWCADALVPIEITSTKPTTYANIGITKNELEHLVTERLGDCHPNICTSRIIEISLANFKTGTLVFQEVPIVTVTFNGLYDDSVTAKKDIAKIYKDESGDGVWHISAPITTFKCQLGRGHQDFSTVSCS